MSDNPEVTSPIVPTPEPIIPKPSFLDKYKKYLPFVIVGVILVIGGFFTWSTVTTSHQTKEENTKLASTVSDLQTKIVTLKSTISDLTDQKKTMENDLLKVKKDLEKNYSRKKYDPTTGKLVEDVTSGSNSSETSSDSNQKMTEEVLTLATKISEFQTENDQLKEKVKTQENTIKTELDKETKTRGGFGIDGGVVVSNSGLSPVVGLEYSILTVPLLDIDLGVSASYSFK